MRSDADPRIVSSALEVVERAERRAALSALEAEKLRHALGGEDIPQSRSHLEGALNPRVERMILGLSEGIVYGMNAGLAAGLAAALLTGSGLYLALSGTAGTLIGLAVAAGREFRPRRPVH